MAFANMVSKTGRKSPGELEMTRSTSAVAVCRSSASFNSFVLRSSCFCNPALASPRPGFGLATTGRLRLAALRRRKSAVLSPAEPPRLIVPATAEIRVDHTQERRYLPCRRPLSGRDGRGNSTNGDSTGAGPCSRRPVAVGNFDNPGARSKLVDQGVGLFLIGGVEVGVPFVEQIDFRIGRIDDFL